MEHVIYVSNNDLQKLQNEVNDRYSQGYRLHGNLVIEPAHPHNIYDSSFYTQTMIYVPPVVEEPVGYAVRG